MRTTDGKLVILDFGLMTEVTEEQRIGLVEFIAHLTIEDWEGLTQDLVTLGEGRRSCSLTEAYSSLTSSLSLISCKWPLLP